MSMNVNATKAVVLAPVIIQWDLSNAHVKKDTNFPSRTTKHAQVSK